MGNRKPHDTGPQRHAEGQHGEKTHRRFIEMLQESRKGGQEPLTEKPDVEGRHRLHQDRQQHDEAAEDEQLVGAGDASEYGE